MKDVLVLKYLHVPIERKDKKPKNMIDAEWDKLDRKVVTTLRQSVANSVYFHIAQETTAESLWKKLHELYERKIMLNKASLIRRLIDLKYE